MSKTNQLLLTPLFLAGCIYLLAMVYTAGIDRVQSQAIANGYAEYWCPDPAKDEVEFRWKTKEEIGVRCVGEFIPVTVDMEDQK